jgi:hypothetical protein
MRPALILCLFFFLFLRSPLAFGEVQATVVLKIVTRELSELRMPVNSPFCLAILPAANTSTTAADPSPQLVAFLQRKGMHPKGASTCYKALKGNVISIELVSEDGGRLMVKVAFVDVTIPPGEDLAVVRRRGVYEFSKDIHGEWLIKSYTATIPEPASKPGAAGP